MTADAGHPQPVGSRGVPAVGDPGRAARELSAGLPPPAPAPPDHVLAEYATRDLEIRAASIRGLLHRYHGQPRQDAFSVVHDAASGTTVVVVADGVGSRPRSHEAAALVVDRLPGHYWTHRDWDIAVKTVNAELTELAARVVEGVADDDRDRHAMATTIVAVAVDRGPGGRRARVVRSDDSTVWWLAPDATWTEVAPVAADDAALHTGAVRALPHVSPALHHAEIAFDCGALFVVTDGVGGPLATSAEVRETLAAWWAAPPSIFRFGAEAGFARRSHLDDRTAVGLWVTPPPPGAAAEADE